MTVTGRPAWHTLAACRGTDPTLFHPSRLDGHDTAGMTRKAKAICTGCPVRWTCLHTHLTDHPTGSDDDLGVWGGTSVRARRALRRDPARLLFVRLRAELEAVA